MRNGSKQFWRSEKCFEEERVPETKLKNWIENQNHNYKNAIKGMSMTHLERRKIWEEFIGKWKQKFIDRDTKWKQMLGKLEKCFEEDRIPETELKNWLHNQIQEYKNAVHGMSPKNLERRNTWEEFLGKWKHKFD
jgi:hypothetical protein